MERIKTITSDQKYTLVREDYNAVADWYDRTYDATREFKEQLQDFVDTLPLKSKVLDVGAGTGKESTVIAEISNVTAFDISEVMLQKLKKAHPEITTVLGNMTNLPFSDNTFSGLWSCRSIIHIPYEDLDKTLREYHRVLQPYGSLGLLFLPSDDPSQDVEEQFLPQPEVKDDGITYYRNLYSSTVMSRLLRETGFFIRKEMDTRGMDNETLHYIRAAKINV